MESILQRSIPTRTPIVISIEKGECALLGVGQCAPICGTESDGAREREREISIFNSLDRYHWKKMQFDYP